MDQCPQTLFLTEGEVSGAELGGAGIATRCCLWLAADRLCWMNIDLKCTGGAPRLVVHPEQCVSNELIYYYDRNLHRVYQKWPFLCHTAALECDITYLFMS